MEITAITQKHTDYPESLQEIASPPKQLYCRGKLEVDRPLISIVGSRKATRYGAGTTYRFSYELAAAGIGIVSGLALGIDAVAHRAAIEAGGYTVAVMAGGLDKTYPARNRELAESIIAHGGALLSEYPAGVTPRKQHFPARNRIVAGLSLGVVVTEAGEGSGALITASFALEQNREVFAVPGNINQSTSRGTNQLIQNGAWLVASAEDILQALQLSRRDATTPNAVALSREEAEILQILKAGATDFDVITAQTTMDVATLNRTLTLMEISGKIRHVGGGQWIGL